MPFNFEKLSMSGLVMVEPVIFGDDRGFFMESFKTTDFTAFGINKRIVQINQSRSQRNVLRGLHYQIRPKGQSKLVRVVTGEIFDVAVDLRQGSPTYGKWEGLRLSADNRKMLYIPEGFAHGFCVLSESADVEYACGEEYSPMHDRGILWNDPELAIKWPVESPIISDKDRKNPPFKQAEKNFIYS